MSEFIYIFQEARLDHQLKLRQLAPPAAAVAAAVQFGRFDRCAARL